MPEDPPPNVDANEPESPATAPAPSGVGSLLQRAKAARDQVAAKAGELKDAGFAKMVETLDDFNAALPVLREAGYTLASVDIGIGIPPKMSASFSASDDVSAENVERLIAAHAEKKFTVLLMKSLYRAWQVQMKIKIAGLKPKGITVEIDLVPSVTVKFA